ncbi:unnamed protein product [Clonostachys rosea]|uniref:Rhodopsin domain-containing protein n=1 Tax=Bionectria ochroleuca TaxID=29856 RepID=A0ABY6UYL4_BIOOC|nr:unnamed protein product [Clonostachys rosea]
MSDLGETSVLSPEFLAQSRGPSIRGVVWVSVVCSIIIVIMRVHTRIFLRRVFGIDDWVIVFAMVLIAAYGAVVELAVQKGLGRHLQWMLMEAPENLVAVALLGQISQPLVVMSCAMGKVSFSLTLMRLAAQRWIHILLWFLVISMTTLHILISIIVFVRCKDPRSTWDTTIVSECWHPETYLNVMYFIGAYSAATDFILALMPWAMLWNLNMKKKEKFGVAIAMSLGVFAGTTAIIKCTKLRANATSKDPTFDVGELLWWAGAENGLIITAACLPTLRPLMRAMFPTTVRSSENNNSYPLKNMSNNANMFTPKKQGQWTAIIESEGQVDTTTFEVNVSYQQNGNDV